MLINTNVSTNILFLGSCRLSNCFHKINVPGVIVRHPQITSSYSAKDIIQEFEWINGIIPNSMTTSIFHTGLWQGVELDRPTYKKMFDDADIFFIEISSLKSIEHNQYYYHLDVANPICINSVCKLRGIADYQYNFITDGRTQLEIDIDKIISFIGNRKLVIVTHMLATIDNEVIPDRKRLIDDLTEICNQRSVSIIYPGEIITNENKSLITPDYSHYTEYGIELVAEFYQRKIKEIMKIN